MHSENRIVTIYCDLRFSNHVGSFRYIHTVFQQISDTNSLGRLHVWRGESEDCLEEDL